MIGAKTCGMRLLAHPPKRLIFESVVVPAGGHHRCPIHSAETSASPVSRADGQKLTAVAGVIEAGRGNMQSSVPASSQRPSCATTPRSGCLISSMGASASGLRLPSLVRPVTASILRRSSTSPRSLEATGPTLASIRAPTSAPQRFPHRSSTVPHGFTAAKPPTMTASSS